MAIYMWREKEPEELCFTANTAGSTVQLIKNGTLTAITLETSTDWTTWNTYTIWNTITLTNIWDKVYFRNTSETTTWFSPASNTNYQFVMTWSIAASWDITSLINKNLTDTLTTTSVFSGLFAWCTSLTSAPKLPATTLTNECYQVMFQWCTSLVTIHGLPATTITENCYFRMFQWCTSLSILPSLPALALKNYCYQYMFAECTNIKVSSTQGWDYQTEYRIPITWTWTWGGSGSSGALYRMFYKAWWTTTTPSINTTYYTSNTVV